MLQRFTFLCLLTTSIFAAAEASVTFMSYNVENLFDTEHDAGKLDYTYLPLSLKRGEMRKELEAHCRTVTSPKWKKECFNWDWNEVVLNEKLERISQVIRDVHGATGEGPDVLILEEVENLKVLKLLNENYLADLGYDIIFKEGWDERGIDVAIFTKLARQESSPEELHKIPNSRHRLRGILQANLLLADNTPLTVFGLHLPSPRNPNEAREDVLKHLNVLKNSVSSNSIVVAGGDFNVTSEEERESSPIKRYMTAAWHAATDFCKGCKGSSYYPPANEWSFLDRFFIGKATESFSRTWELDRDSVRVHSSSRGQVDRNGYPIRFKLGTGKNSSGISDHLPLVFQLVR